MTISLTSGAVNKLNTDQTNGTYVVQVVDFKGYSKMQNNTNKTRYRSGLTVNMIENNIITIVFSFFVV